MSILGYDTTGYKPVSFDPIPAGEYRAVIKASETKATKAGDGQMLKLELEIIEGEYSKRIIFDNLNIINPNQQAQSIARGQVAAISAATGVLNPKDSAEFHGKQMIIKVGIKPAQGNYEESNSIKAYKPINIAKPQIETKSIKPFDFDDKVIY